MNHIKKLTLLAVLFTAPSLAMASVPMATQLSYGNTNGVQGFRVALQVKPANWHWHAFSLNIHAAIARWHATTAEQNTLYDFAIAPEIRWHFLGSTSFKPYIYAGVGPSYATQTVIAGRHLGQRFLFENNLGVGVDVGQFEAEIGALHYSNAGLAPQNSGFNELPLLTVGYHFTKDQA